MSDLDGTLVGGPGGTAKVWLLGGDGQMVCRCVCACVCVRVYDLDGTFAEKSGGTAKVWFLDGRAVVVVVVDDGGNGDGDGGGIVKMILNIFTHACTRGTFRIPLASL